MECLPLPPLATASLTTMGSIFKNVCREHIGPRTRTEIYRGVPNKIWCCGMPFTECLMGLDPVTSICTVIYYLKAHWRFHGIEQPGRGPVWHPMHHSGLYQVLVHSRLPWCRNVLLHFRRSMRCGQWWMLQLALGIPYQDFQPQPASAYWKPGQVGVPFANSVDGPHMWRTLAPRWLWPINSSCPDLSNCSLPVYIQDAWISFEVKDFDQLAKEAELMHHVSPPPAPTLFQARTPGLPAQTKKIQNTRKPPGSLPCIPISMHIHIGYIIQYHLIMSMHIVHHIISFPYGYRMVITHFHVFSIVCGDITSQLIHTVTMWFYHVAIFHMVTKW